MLVRRATFTIRSWRFAIDRPIRFRDSEQFAFRRREFDGICLDTPLSGGACEMLAPLLRCHTPHQFQLLTALRDRNGLERDFTRFPKFRIIEAKYRNL